VGFRALENLRNFRWIIEEKHVQKFFCFSLPHGAVVRGRDFSGNPRKIEEHTASLQGMAGLLVANPQPRK